MVTQISLLARGATTRRARLSYPQRLPTLDSELGLQSLVRLLRSLDKLDTSVSRSSPLHAFHPELSAPPDKSRFQCSVIKSTFRSSVKQQSRLRYHVVNV